MRDFDGNLLIGGMTLKHVHGQLEEDEKPKGSHDWLLSGRLNIANPERKLLELERQFLVAWISSCRTCRRRSVRITGQTTVFYNIM